MWLLKWGYSELGYATNIKYKPGFRELTMNKKSAKSHIFMLNTSLNDNDTSVANLLEWLLKPWAKTVLDFTYKSIQK